MELKVTEENNFKYIDVGNGPVLLLLHGLFGALSNFAELINHFKEKYRVVIPMLPIYEGPLDKTSLDGLLEYVKEFVAFKNLKNVIPIGNSLGGHLALKYVLDKPQNSAAMVLTGSSGLFENALGSSYPKKGDYEFVKTKTQETFFDPKVATKELIDEVFDIVNNREKALHVLYMARSAIRNNMAEFLPSIKIPSLLIWGKDDSITPAFVAEEFDKLLPNSKLKWIDKCGHAAMMEHPKKFNELLEVFINDLTLEKN